MPRQIRVVTIQLALKEEAFQENPIGPEDEISALLTDNAITDPESTILDWKYVGTRPQEILPVTVQGEDEGVFDELTRREEEGNPADGRSERAATLLQKAKETEENLEESNLDELIHDIASKAGSDLNNQPLEERVAYLQDQGVSDKDILAALLPQ